MYKPIGNKGIDGIEMVYRSLKKQYYLMRINPLLLIHVNSDARYNKGKQNQVGLDSRP